MKKINNSEIKNKVKSNYTLSQEDKDKIIKSRVKTTKKIPIFVIELNTTLLVSESRLKTETKESIISKFIKNYENRRYKE